MPIYALSARQAGPTSITLAWPSITGANSFTVLMSTSQFGVYSPVVSGITGYECTVGGLSTGTMYFFKVEATAFISTGTQVEVSEPIVVRARPLRPSWASASSGSRQGQIELNWGTVNECDGYAIYISDSPYGVFSLIEVLEGKGIDKVAINGLRSGDRYYFKIAAVSQAGAAKIPSVFTGIISAAAR
jgi:hypothetical protein